MADKEYKLMEDLLGVDNTVISRIGNERRGIFFLDARGRTGKTL